MSDPIRARGHRRELATVVCWPLVALAGGVIAGLGALGLCFAESQRLKPRAATIGAVKVAERPKPARSDAEEPSERPVALPHGATARKRPSPPERLVRKSRPMTQHEPANLDEAALDESLWKASREVDLRAKEGAVEELWRACKDHASLAARAKLQGEELPPSEPMERLLEARADLAGMPLLTGKACRLEGEQAEVLGKVSAHLRSFGSSAGERSALLLAFLREEAARATWSAQPQLFVSPLEQTCQVEGLNARLELLATLAKLPGDESFRAIARRAVFDDSRVVREKAVSLLQPRDRDPAREVFLAGLRHPWAPAADHAALALAALGDTDAIPLLRDLLEEGDPNSPYRSEGRWVKRELVRVNHMRNCALCHPPSFDENDPLAAPAPTPGHPLPAAYYRQQRRSGDQWVRADVVYFRQDFSVMQRVPEPDKWPAWQRFDYFVVLRELGAEESALEAREAQARKLYPQREAIRWALARLEGLTLRR